MFARTLFIATPLLERIRQHATKTYPNECCGVLIGRDLNDAARVVDEVLTAENVADASEQSRRFAIDPRRLIEAEKRASEMNRAVIGFYHSHPDHPARPSERDREDAWPFYSYVIVSVERGVVSDVTSWVLSDEPGFLQQRMGDTYAAQT